MKDRLGNEILVGDIIFCARKNELSGECKVIGFTKRKVQYEDEYCDYVVFQQRCYGKEWREGRDIIDISAYQRSLRGEQT